MLMAATGFRKAQAVYHRLYVEGRKMLASLGLYEEYATELASTIVHYH